jgi:6-phosphofructokinase
VSDDAEGRVVLAGNAVIAQSGGPTGVINRSLVGAIREMVKSKEIRGIYGARHGIKGIMNEDFVDLRAETPRSLDKIAKTPSAALGSVRLKPTAEHCAQIFEVCQKHDIRYFFYIGGNDSAETAHIVATDAAEAKYDMRVFHIPKTIDNDLRESDHCPGYGSAARFVAMALMGDQLDNRSIPGVKIDVIMGRHAGFLTAASVLGQQRSDDGPHLVYLPERPFSVPKFIEDVRRVKEELGRCVVAVSEGIADANGDPVYRGDEVDAHGNVQLSGTGALGDFLVKVVKDNLGTDLRVRADTFGYLQRCFPEVVSKVDADEATAVGREAVKAAVLDERANGSVVIRRTGTTKTYMVSLGLTELENVAKHTRSVPDEFVNSEGNGVTEAFRNYALPLTGRFPRFGWVKGKPI